MDAGVLARVSRRLSSGFPDGDDRLKRSRVLAYQLMRRAGVLCALLLSACAGGCGEEGGEIAASGQGGATSGATTSTSSGGPSSVSATATSGTGGAEGGWTALSWGEPGCEAEMATGPAPGIPTIAWEGCGAGCEEVVVDWYTGSAPISTLKVRADGAEVGSVVQTEDHMLAVAWKLPTFEPSFALRVTRPCGVRPLYPVAAGFWTGLREGVTGSLGFFPRENPEMELEVVPGVTGVVTDILADDTHIYVSAGDENALIRWERGQVEAERFTVRGAQYPTFLSNRAVVFVGGENDTRHIYKWETDQSVPTPIWSVVGRSALGLAVAGGEVVWVDGAGNGVPQYTDLRIKWAPEGQTLTPVVQYPISFYSEVAANAQKAVKGDSAGIRFVDRAAGTTQDVALANGRGLPHMGKTPMSPLEEVWVETIGGFRRIEVP